MLYSTEEKNNNTNLLNHMNKGIPIINAIKEKEIRIAGCKQTIAQEQEKAKIFHVILCFIFGFFISSFFAFDSIAVGSVPVIAMIIFVVSGFMGVIRRINHKKKLEKSVKEKNIYEQELKILKNDAVLCWLPYDYRDSTAFA